MSEKISEALFFRIEPARRKEETPRSFIERDNLLGRRISHVMRVESVMIPDPCLRSPPSIGSLPVVFSREIPWYSTNVMAALSRVPKSIFKVI